MPAAKMMSSVARGVAAAALVACLVEVAAACDAKCLHAETLAKVNSLRASLGKAPLRSGTISMLNNAVAHSRHMAETGDFSHQDLGQVTKNIGCDLFCSGENIAWFGGGAIGGAPEKCFNLWRNSPGHYNNMISENDYSVIGIFQGSNGRVYCTQTLAKERSREVKTVVGGAQCDLASGNSTPTNAPGSATSKPTTTIMQMTTTRTTTVQPAQAMTPPATQAQTQASKEATTTTLVTKPKPNKRPGQKEPASNQPVTSGDQCTSTYQRCAGEDNHDFIPYVGCCEAGDVCMTKPSMGWGKFCMPKAAHESEAEETSEENDDANADSTPETHTHWVDWTGRKFKLTGREAKFEEECTYHKNGDAAVCILCLTGPKPGICFDSRTLRRRMREPVTYENAF